MRKILLFVVALLLLVGCSSNSTGGEEQKTDSNTQVNVKNPGTVIFEVETNTSSLDPATVFDPTGVSIVMQVYEQLLNYNEETGEIEPWLAEEYSVSDDGLTYTFKLREGITFHDGTPFNAEAVKFNIDRIIVMNQPRGMNTFLSGKIKGSAKLAQSDFTEKDVQEYIDTNGVEVVDEYTVKIHLEKPFSSFLQMMAINYAGMISPTFVEENGGITPGAENEHIASNAVGTGPYKLESYNVGSGEVVLVAYEDYWGTPDDTGVASIEKVVVRPVDDPLTRSMNLRSGESDLALITTDEILHYIDNDKWRNNKELESIIEGVDVLGPFELNRIEAMLMNVDIKENGESAEFQPFQDERVREAFILAFDQEAYINQVLHGFGNPINGPIPTGWLGYDDSIEGNRVDLDRAKELLIEAGKDLGFSPENPKSIEINYPAGEEESEASFLMLASLINSMDVGLQLNVTPLAYSSFSTALYNGELAMIRVSWVGSLPDPDANLSAFGDGNNGVLARSAGYINEDLIELINAQSLELDEAKREELVKQAVKTIHEDNMYIWRSQRTSYMAQRDWIDGFKHRRSTIGPKFYELTKGE